MIRAAIVGLGWWGRTIARELADSGSIVPVLGVDPDPRARDAACEQGMRIAESFQDILHSDDIDAVILCTPHKCHAEQIIAAAAAGKHVFCEKPLCPTAAEADAAIDAMSAAGLVLGLGHERRFEAPVVELRRRAEAGEFGRTLLLEANFSQDKFLALPADNWRLSAKDAPVGPLSATGIHMADLAIALFGAPDRVWARLATLATQFGNGDTLSVTLGFADGRTAAITAILTTPFDGRIALYGSAGWMEIRDRSHPEHPTGWDVTVVRRGVKTERHFSPPCPAVRDNLEAFARAIAGEAPYPIPLAEMRINARVFEAVTRSALSGAIETV